MSLFTITMKGRTERVSNVWPGGAGVGRRGTSQAAWCVCVYLQLEHATITEEVVEGELDVAAAIGRGREGGEVKRCQGAQGGASAHGEWRMLWRQLVSLVRQQPCSKTTSKNARVHPSRGRKQHAGVRAHTRTQNGAAMHSRWVACRHSLSVQVRTTAGLAATSSLRVQNGQPSCSMSSTTSGCGGCWDSSKV